MAPIRDHRAATGQVNPNVLPLLGVGSAFCCSDTSLFAISCHLHTLAPLSWVRALPRWSTPECASLSIATGNTQIFELPSSGHYGEYSADRAIIEKEYLTATLPIISLSSPLIVKHWALGRYMCASTCLVNSPTNPLEANWPARPRFIVPPLRGFRLLAKWDRAGHRLKCL